MHIKNNVCQGILFPLTKLPNPRKTLRERLEVFEYYEQWRLSSRLFGDVGCDINDFLIENYTYFLDHVNSLRDLIQGLCELSPFTDDALEIAEKMNEQDFRQFKRDLATERKAVENGGPSRMPRKYLSLVLPKQFVPALFLAEQALAPLGATLIRLMEYDEKENPPIAISIK